MIVTPHGDPSIVKEAVISIEDKRFPPTAASTSAAIARAFVQDLRHKGSVQGASTIEEQFIKNALQAQSHRTIFEKLREAALAYQLSHKWSKEKIITAYLNTIYFGNGAYGIEAAAQTYFGHEVNHLGCGTPGHQLCVQQLQPWEAALLAGIIQSPTGYDPVNHPAAARDRRDLVLPQMYEQGYLTRAVYEESINQAMPAAEDIQAPAGADGGRGRRRLLHELGAAAADRTLRRAARLRRRPASQDDARPRTAAGRRTGGQRLPRPTPATPRAALVAIENSTGEVRAMVGGRNYDESPFNLATEGERQPGSSFKAFDLAAALEDGISPDSEWTSKQKVFYVPNTSGPEKFVVHNDEGAYTGVEHAHERDRLLRQLDLRRSRAEGGNQTDRAPGSPHGHHDTAVDQPRDDDRRPDRGRDAARHGSCL